ncbi:MAG: hypothetical protein AAFU53_14605 [Cyanobacteria bacterium J06632_3]
MASQELPLLELFTRLKEAGLPLGLNEYHLALKALQAGFGVDDQDALARLCKSLWVKSQDDAHIFDYHFSNVFNGQSRQRPLHQSVESPHWKRHIRSTHEIAETTSRYVVRMATLSAVGCAVILFSVLRLEDPSGVLFFRLPILFPEPRQPLPQQERTPETAQSGIGLLSTMPLWLKVVFILLTTPASLLLVRWLLQRLSNRNRAPKDFLSPDQKTLSALKEVQDIQDEVQLAQVIRQNITNAQETRTNYSNKPTDYLPITGRQMKQGWRYLRRSVREGAPTEFDVEATVKQIGQHGLLLAPVLIPPRVNKTELILFIDQQGSMVPFRSLSERLTQTALRAGRLGDAGIYYFHNCPYQYVFRDQYAQDAVSVTDALSRIGSTQASVLIFSDAGAARGGFNTRRIELTLAFLAQLRRRVKYVGWLNPLPPHRWQGTTAAEIARVVPMFAFSRQGFQNAVSTLKGH